MCYFQVGDAEWSKVYPCQSMMSRYLHTDKGRSTLHMYHVKEDYGDKISWQHKSLDGAPFFFFFKLFKQWWWKLYKHTNIYANYSTFLNTDGEKFTNTVSMQTILNTYDENSVKTTLFMQIVLTLIFFFFCKPSRRPSIRPYNRYSTCGPHLPSGQH